ncbi:hypothetical protein B0I35DRAFT_105464 [Stachybotrys elegans]|uniref:Secreted protein n=1 Tax=Stachybotrys elegans TaxID=80388 RepID=A0A8K0SLJ9_9HYPO|nr:hypothetical protein B0I35DRAFT_105464 [Stachybotrys elegans]
MPTILLLLVALGLAFSFSRCKRGKRKSFLLQGVGRVRKRETVRMLACFFFFFVLFPSPLFILSSFSCCPPPFFRFLLLMKSFFSLFFLSLMMTGGRKESRKGNAGRKGMTLYDVWALLLFLLRKRKYDENFSLTWFP